MVEIKATEYEKKIAECRASGKTVKEYCDINGIPYETFRTWVRRSRKRKGERSENKTYEEYRQIVIEAKTSGKTGKEWCAENGINYVTFCGWRKKVNRKEGREKFDKENGIASRPKGRQPEPKVTPLPVLCEVRW